MDSTGFRFSSYPSNTVQRPPTTDENSPHVDRASASTGNESHDVSTFQSEGSIAPFSTTGQPLSVSPDLHRRMVAPRGVLALHEMQVGHEKALHIARNAHTLEAHKSAAERALRVTIGVHRSPESENILPTIEMEGPLAKLKEFCRWIPAVTVLGNGFQLPPNLVSDRTRQFFSHAKRTTSVFTQDQLRDILCRKKKQLAKELGLDISDSQSTYLAQAVADSVILYCYFKWGLPVSTLDNPGWLVHRRGASNTGNAESDARHGNFQILQSLMLPVSTAMRTAGEDGYDIEVAVDSGNKLVMRGCSVQEIVYEQSAVHEYKLWANGDGTYERIASGAIREGAFQQCGVRLLLGGSLS